MSAARFPWDEAMAFGLGRLNLAPHAFWATTPRELAAAMAVFAERPRSGPLDRVQFDALAAAFPDRVRRRGDR